MLARAIGTSASEHKLWTDTASPVARSEGFWAIKNEATPELHQELCDQLKEDTLAFEALVAADKTKNMATGFYEVSSAKANAPPKQKVCVAARLQGPARAQSLAAAAPSEN